MERLKKVIIILSVICIIILISVLILNSNIKKEEGQDKVNEEYSFTNSSQEFTKDIGLVESYSTFFSVEEMLETFIKMVGRKANQETYNLLDSTYILNRNITKENVLEQISDIVQYSSKLKIREMYEKKNITNAVYYIHCILEKEHVGKEFFFALYKDESNLTYSVEPINKEYFETQTTTTNQGLEEKRIEINANNKSSFLQPSEEEIVEKYFGDFLENALYYTDYTYSILEAEYKTKSFPTIQDFNSYVETKRDIFLTYDQTNLKPFGEFESMDEYMLYLAQAKSIELKQYQIRKEDGCNKYVCVDSEGNYYTFSAATPYNYTAILGNYVIPTEDFMKEYKVSGDAQKVILNIKRFFMGIDDKNYGYSYSVLSEAFKNNKYPTKTDFVNYAKQNFFEENEIEYVSYEKENGVYVYKIKIKDATGNSSEEKEYNMIMKLNDGTDFEMSFGQ